MSTGVLDARGVHAQAVVATANLGRVAFAGEGAPVGSRLTVKVKRDAAPALHKIGRR